VSSQSCDEVLKKEEHSIDLRSHFQPASLGNASTWKSPFVPPLVFHLLILKVSECGDKNMKGSQDTDSQSCQEDAGKLCNCGTHFPPILVQEISGTQSYLSFHISMNEYYFIDSSPEHSSFFQVPGTWIELSWIPTGWPGRFLILLDVSHSSDWTPVYPLTTLHRVIVTYTGRNLSQFPVADLHNPNLWQYSEYLCCFVESRWLGKTIVLTSMTTDKLNIQNGTMEASLKWHRL
jgi:hypothetical protein